MRRVAVVSLIVAPSSLRRGEHCVVEKSCFKLGGVDDRRVGSKFQIVAAANPRGALCSPSVSYRRAVAFEGCRMLSRRESAVEVGGELVWHGLAVSWEC